jgi:hypothetical protein
MRPPVMSGASVDCDDSSVSTDFVTVTPGRFTT